jgi:hypothetical protein
MVRRGEARKRFFACHGAKTSQGTFTGGFFQS